MESVNQFQRSWEPAPEMTTTVTTGDDIGYHPEYAYLTTDTLNGFGFQLSPAATIVGIEVQVSPNFGFPGQNGLEIGAAAAPVDLSELDEFLKWKQSRRQKNQNPKPVLIGAKRQIKLED